MKCKDIKMLLMDFLYGEAEEKDNARVKNHLESCDGCRKELQALKETSGILQKWEDVDPNLNLLFVSDKNTVWERFRERFHFAPKKLGYGFALGLASVFLLMALANTSIQYQDGNFSMKLGIFQENSSEAVESAANQEMLSQLQQQNIQLMSRMIEQSEKKQRQEIISALNRFSNSYQDVRSSDLKHVGSSLDVMEKELYRRLEKRTSEQYNDLIRQINFQQDNR